MRRIPVPTKPTGFIVALHPWRSGEDDQKIITALLMISEVIAVSPITSQIAMPVLISKKETRDEGVVDRIQTHLFEMENDRYNNSASGLFRRRPLYNPSIGSYGLNFVIKYHAKQKGYRLTNTEALAYLAWLDAGNIGQHYHMDRVPS